MSAVQVVSPARLHLGMLAVAGDGARRFGGLGVSVDRPAVVVEARRADELSAEGPDADRALVFAQRCQKALGTLIKPAEVQFHHEVTNQFLWNLF